MSDASSRAYKVRPLTPHFGVECLDINLSSDTYTTEHTPSPIHTNPAFIQQLKDDLRDHRMILFRNQTNLSGQRQVDISNTLGKIQSFFHHHPQSPHTDILRASNDPAVGCTNVGRSGWHNDGIYQTRPFQFQTMYFPRVCHTGGETEFVPLNECLEYGLSVRERKWLEGVWFMGGGRYAPLHPLIYRHPTRGDDTMLFHCGERLVKMCLREHKLHDNNTTAPAPNDWQSNATEHMTYLRPQTIASKLTKLFDAQLPKIGLSMKWQTGDFMIIDNLGLAHLASRGTQLTPETVGLRILHRTTITGGVDVETIPTKRDGRASFWPDEELLERNVSVQKGLKSEEEKKGTEMKLTKRVSSLWRRWKQNKNTQQTFD